MQPSDIAGETRSVLKDGRIAVVRPVSPDDARAITDLLNLIGGERRYILSERANWTLEEERQTLANWRGSDRAYYVAEVDGQLCGTISVMKGRWAKNSHTADFGMGCRSDFRGIGVGHALLERVIGWARASGVKKLKLEVFSTNQQAIDFYLRAGFVEEGRLKGEFLIDGGPVDGVFMAMWL